VAKAWSTRCTRPDGLTLAHHWATAAELAGELAEPLASLATWWRRRQALLASATHDVDRFTAAIEQVARALFATASSRVHAGRWC
jgi:hypothetical protein